MRGVNIGGAMLNFGMAGRCGRGRLSINRIRVMRDRWRDIGLSYVCGRIWAICLRRVWAQDRW